MQFCYFFNTGLGESCDPSQCILLEDETLIESWLTLACKKGSDHNIIGTFLLLIRSAKCSINCCEFNNNSSGLFAKS